AVGHADLAGFRRAVADAVHEAAPPRHRRDVDDRAAARLDHLRHGEADAQIRAREARVDRVEPLVDGVVLHRLRGAAVAGVVDEGVHASVRAHRRVDDRPRARFGRRIGGDRRRRSAGADDGLRRRADERRRPRGADDACALAREALGHDAPNPFAGTGDDRDASLELSHVSSRRTYRPGLQPPTMPAARRRPIAASLMPRRSRSTSSVCSPTRGAGRRTDPGVSLNTTGGATMRTRPATGCSHSTIARRAATCGCSSTSSIVLIAPMGMPAGRRIASHSSYVFPRNASCSASISVARFALRAAFVTYRGSSTRCASPTSGQKRFHSLSLPMPIAMSRVLVRNVWYGSSMPYAVPIGPGTMPSATYAPIAPVRIPSCPRSIDKSTKCPRPVL